MMLLWGNRYFTKKYTYYYSMFVPVHDCNKWRVVICKMKASVFSQLAIVKAYLL